MSGSGPAPSLVPVVPTLLWDSVPIIFVPTPLSVPAVLTLIWDSVPADSAPALFLVPVVPILLWEPISVISGSGGFDPDSVFGSGGSGWVMEPISDSVFSVVGPGSGLASGSGLGFGSGGFDSAMGLSSDSVSGFGGSDSVGSD